MSSKSWLKSLFKRVTAPSVVAPLKRQRRRLQFDALEERATPATALTWTGAVDANWSNPGNWTGGGAPSAVNNILNFNADGTTRFATNNDIAGLTGLTINVTDANSGANADFTLAGMGVGVTSLTNTKTDGVSSATKITLGMTGAGASVTAAAGEVAILNGANVFDAASTLNVPTGGIASIAVSPSDAMGNAQFNLTGGQLKAVQSAVTTQPGLLVGQKAVANDVNANDVPDSALGIDFQMFPMMPDISRNVPAADTQFQTNTHTWGNNTTYFYSGEIFFPNSNGDGTGSIQFAEQNDDSTFVRIDGVTYLSDSTWNNANVSTDPNTSNPVVTLPTGWHTIDLRFGNGGGGAGPANQTTNGAAGWVTGNGSTTNPTGKGFGYRVTDPSGTLPAQATTNLDAKIYRRLYATPTPLTTTAATVANGLATVTTTIPHGLLVGESITLAGFTPAALNGTFTVATVTGNNTFTLSNSASGLANGTVFGTVSRFDDGVRLRAMAPAAAGALGNNVNVSGSSTITIDPFVTGNLTFGTLNLASGATLNTTNSGAASMSFTTTGLAGTATINTGANGTVTLNGAVSQSAPSGLIKSGAGTLNLNSANTYTGLTFINAGTVVVGVNGGLGTSAGGATDGTFVASGARLALKSSYTNPETLFLSGTGTTTTNGALSTDGSTTDKTFAGQIFLQANSVIANPVNTLTLTGGIITGASQLTLGGAGTVALNTAGITGSGTLVKADGGSAILNVASPNFIGDINVNAGTLRASVDGALGAINGVTNVAAGGTLRFDGSASGLNYATPETIRISGAGAGSVGALNIAGGDVTLAGPVNLAGSATIGSGDAGKKLTLNGALNLSLIGDLSFTGAGNIDVMQGFGNGASGAVTTVAQNALLAQWFNISGVARDENFIGNMTNNGGPLARTPVLGTGLLNASSPNGGALNFPDLASLNASTQNPTSGSAATFGDDFAFLWTGMFKAVIPGPYQFGVGQTSNGVDDEMSIYIDTNDNGVFESSERFATTVGVGCCGNGNSSAARNFAAGEAHRIAIGFHEEGGGEKGSANFRIVGDPTFDSFTAINPGDASQAGMWSATNSVLDQRVVANSVTKNGTGVVTLFGNNTYNGTTTINAGALVAGNVGALGSGPAGTVVNNGGTLGLTGGIALANEAVTFNGAGASSQPGAIANISGANSFTGTLNALNVSQGTVSIGSTSGTLTLNGAVNLGYSKLVVGGAGDVVVNSTIGGAGVDSLSNGISETIFNASTGDAQNNIEEMRNRALTTADGRGTLTGQISYDDNNGGGADITARAAALGASGFDAGDWGAVWVTTFTPDESGPWKFHAFGVDDNVGFWIDVDQNGIFESSNKFGGRGCCGDTGDFTTPSLVAGQHYLLGISLTDTGGGGVFRNVQFQSPTAAGAGGGVYSNLDASAFPGLFQVALFADNSLVKNGAGTLTLNGANIYNGNTTITGGTVNFNASNAYSGSATSTLTVSGANTVVNLFASAANVTTVGTADFGAGTGKVNTGAGKLAVRSQLKLGDGYAVGGDMTVLGANVIDNSAPRTIAAATGTLNVSHVVNTPITLPDSGQMFLNGTNQSNTFTYTADSHAKVLVVSIASRSDTLNMTPTVTYAGMPLVAAVDSEGTAVTAVNSHIYYLYLPPTGVASDLKVDFSAPIAGSFAVYAFTLDGVDTNFTPIVGKVANTEGSPTSQSVTLTNVPAGAWVVSNFNYRLGNTGQLKETVTNGAVVAGGVQNDNGTILPGGAVAANGNFWYRRDANIIGAGGLFSNLSPGNVTVTATGAGASGTHFSGAALAFKPLGVPTAINLPNTNFSFANGTSLSLNAPGDAVIGSVTSNGNAGIAAGATAPSSVTLGGTGGAGAGTLSINDNLGLKLAAGGTYAVDLNGLTAGTQYDQASVNGAVNLNGANLNATTGFTPAIGNSFTIISNDGTDPVVGTFAGLPQGSTVFGGATAYTISYTGGDGNDVVLTAAPAGAATTTTLAATPLATTGGSSVMFTATVAPSPGAGGIVTFLDNGVAIPGGANVAVVDGVATFATTSLAVGTHPVTASYSGAAGFNPSTSNAQSVVITGSTATGPKVVSVTTNGGIASLAGPQHSRMASLQVVFDQAVQLDPDAMALSLHTNNVVFGGVAQAGGMGSLPTNLNVNSTDNITWTVTFSGNTDAGADGFQSLKDGVYDLNIDAAKVHAAAAPTTTMAANSTTTFHRLFGDTNAPVTPAGGTAGVDFSAVVNTGDNLILRGAFNNAPNYKAFLDVNGDGLINTGDNLQFRSRFNKTLTWSV